MDAPLRTPPPVRAPSSAPPRAMRALVRDGGEVRLAEVPTPLTLAAGEALVRVLVAGLCRTDCYVADGRLAAGPGPRILGHEIAGVVVARGAAAADVELGALVSVDPRIPCGACDSCLKGHVCPTPGFLGVDVDGGFADYLRVPARSLVVAPPGLDLRAVAYVEPIAATLAILGAGIEAGERGVVVGRGRIAGLTARVLALHGFADVALHDPAVEPPPPAGAFDFAVETGVDSAAIAAIVRALRPRGRLVLKSRGLDPLVIDPMALIKKEVRISAAYYGSFAAAVRLLGDARLDLAPLWTTPRPLGEHAALLAEAARGEGRKLFFALGDVAGPDLDPGERRCAGSSAPSR